MSSLLERLLRKQTEATIAMQPLECFELTIDEWNEVMCSTHFCIDTGPRPPIKATAVWSGRSGLFSSGISGSYTEYDYHAPEYLEARKNWKPSEPKLFGVPVKLLP